jgi:hypothetical protein
MSTSGSQVHACLLVKAEKLPRADAFKFRLLSVIRMNFARLSF